MGCHDSSRSWLAEGDPVGTGFVLQFPSERQDQAVRFCEVLGAGIADSVEKRSYRSSLHPLNRLRRTNRPPQRTASWSPRTLRRLEARGRRGRVWKRLLGYVRQGSPLRPTRSE